MDIQIQKYVEVLIDKFRYATAIKKCEVAI